MRSQARASARRTNDNLWIFGSLGATEKKCGRGEKGFLPGVIHKLLTFDLANCGAGAAAAGGGFGAWAVKKSAGEEKRIFPREYGNRSQQAVSGGSAELVVGMCGRSGGGERSVGGLGILGILGFVDLKSAGEEEMISPREDEN